MDEGQEAREAQVSRCDGATMEAADIDLEYEKHRSREVGLLAGIYTCSNSAKLESLSLSLYLSDCRHSKGGRVMWYCGNILCAEHR